MTRIFEIKQRVLFVLLWIAGLTISVSAWAVDVQDVMAPLLAPPAAEQAENVLAKAIQDARMLPPASAFVLTNRLRLQLGAHLLASERHDQARAVLRQIDITSPVAISASLLMADSYRLQQNREEAVQWFLRAAQQYPYDPVTLEGLINAAQEFEQDGAPQAARALYHQVTEQTQQALQQLDALAQQPVIEPVQVLFPSEALDEPVRKTLLSLVLHDPRHDMLTRAKALQDNVQQLWVLQQQNEQLSQQLETLNDQLLRYQQQRQTLQDEYQQSRQQLQVLMQRVQADDFSQAQRDVRLAVTQLRNQLTRQQASLDFIDRVIKAMPDMVGRVSARQARLGDALRDQLVANKTAVEATLNQAVATYQTALKDLAGRALLEEGTLLEKLLPAR